MTWIFLVFALETGWVPHSLMFDYTENVIDSRWGTFYQTFDFYAVAFGFIRVGGFLTVYDWRVQSDSIELFPFQLVSMIYVEGRLGYIVIGAKHECAHPVTPYQPILGTKPHWDGGAVTYYIRFETNLEW